MGVRKMKMQLVFLGYRDIYACPNVKNLIFAQMMYPLNKQLLSLSAQFKLRMEINFVC